MRSWDGKVWEARLDMPCPLPLSAQASSTAFLFFFFLIKSACKTLLHQGLCTCYPLPGIPPWSSNNWVLQLPFSFSAVPGYMWILVLSSPTRGWAHAPCPGRQRLNSRATREIPPFSFLLMSPPHRDHPVGSRCPKHHHPISLYLYFHCFIHSIYRNLSFLFCVLSF